MSSIIFLNSDYSEANLVRFFKVHFKFIFCSYYFNNYCTLPKQQNDCSAGCTNNNFVQRIRAFRILQIMRFPDQSKQPASVVKRAVNLTDHSLLPFRSSRDHQKNARRCRDGLHSGTSGHTALRCKTALCCKSAGRSSPHLRC